MIYVFDDYELDTYLYELRHAGQPMQLEPKVFDVLVYLIRHRDRVVTKEELLEHLWPDQFISDATLNHCVMAARKAVGDNGRTQRLIKTLRSRGYRFTAHLEEREVAAPESQDAVVADASSTAMPLPLHNARVPSSQQGSTSAAEPPLPHRRAAHSPVPSAVEGERKPVTVLSCVLADAARLMEELGPDMLHHITQQYFAIAIREVQQYDGTITQFLDGGFLALFGAPVAYEDHARRAVLAAMALQRRLEAGQDDLGQPLGAELAMRMGLNTGLVLVGSIGDDFRLTSTAVEGTTDWAIRCQQQAAPGTIVVSEATSRLIKDVVRLEADTPIRGTQPTDLIRTYRVVARELRGSMLARRGRRGISTFVGRERELTTLHALLTQVEDGQGQVVGIVGEPGMGKSRLLYEFRRSLRETRGAYVAGHCLSYGSATPYLPVLEVLRHAWSIAAGDPPDVITLKVYEGLRTEEMEPDEWAAYLLHLLGGQGGLESLSHLSPEAIKARTFATLRQLCLGRTEQRPLIIVVEDLHWIDATTEEFLTSLVEYLAGAAVLLLTTYRPGYRPPWMDKSYATQMALARLTLDDSWIVVQSILRSAEQQDLPAQEILTKAAGNPFFLEELAQSLAEHGAPHMILTVPDTIQAVLAARIDRLPVTEKRLLQTAAVIGKDVPFPLLQAITDLPEEALRRSLMSLQTAEFLHQRRDVSEPAYTFKHALTQEVAYRSLLASTRQQHHQRIAQVLEAQLPETVAKQPELLAHHFTEAGLSAQAIPYWQRASQRAIGSSAHVEATAHLHRGLDLIATLPDTSERAQHELALQMTLGPALMATKGYAAPEVEQVYTRARALCEQVGDTPQRFSVLFGSWGLYFMRAQHQTARELGTQCLALAQRMQQPAPLLRAHSILGTTLFILGELLPAQDHLQQGLTLYDPRQRRSPRDLQDPGVLCLAYMAFTLWLSGYADQAVTKSREALTMARGLSHPFSLAVALGHVAAFHQFYRERLVVRELAEEVITLAAEKGYAYYAAAGNIYQGWTLTQEGHSEEGIAQIRQGLTDHQAMRAELHRPYFLTLLAEAYLRTRQIGKGLAVLTEAQALVRQNGERWWEAELYRLEAELLLQQSDATEAQAEIHLRHAIASAHSQGAKMLELRAVTSLSRLWQRQGKKEDAHQILAGVYNGFTEGFDNPDVLDAQTLLAL